VFRWENAGVRIRTCLFSSKQLLTELVWERKLSWSFREPFQRISCAFGPHASINALVFEFHIAAPISTDCFEIRHKTGLNVPEHLFTEG
jgi:hypothetical protein